MAKFASASAHPQVVMVSEPHAHGTVRFVGGTMFAAGDWIGVLRRRHELC